MLLILGATSLVRPLAASEITLIDLGMMIFVTALALALMLTREYVGRREGGALLGVYVLYMVWLYAQ